MARIEALGSKLEEEEGEKAPESEVITSDRREGEEKTLEGRVHKGIKKLSVDQDIFLFSVFFEGDRFDTKAGQLQRQLRLVTATS